jgi:hypothetical protein
LAGSVRAVGPGRFPTSTPPEVVVDDVAVCGAVAALGPSVGSVRAVRPGRFPAEGPLPGIWAFGPGTLSPMASRAVSSRLFRRRALRLRPVRDSVLPVICAPTVVRKGPKAAPAGSSLAVRRRALS